MQRQPLQTGDSVVNKPMNADSSDNIQRLLDARLHDPFTVLGIHPLTNGCIVRAFLPEAEQVHITDTACELARIEGTDLFEYHGPRQTIPDRYSLSITDKQGAERVSVDPYAFPAQIPDYDLYLFGNGRHWHIYRILGANQRNVDGITGTLFATWAPNAERVSVVGDFNHWNGRRHPMRSRGGSGVWELFIPGIVPGALYKFEIRNSLSGDIMVKNDPYGRQFELRPSTAALVTDDTPYAWQDADWMENRKDFDWQHEPMSVYEVHLGSWQRDSNGEFLDYRELAHRLVSHIQETGFTHIELLPVSEHPLDASWGYQATGFFAPTSRHGTPDGLRYFVDYCHNHGIGVFIDWVPGHFPRDTHALARFDGTALYEHEDPRRGEHRDWGTLIFNYGRNEVRNFLLASAIYWLEELHIDGLRVDAVASMLYLDYSREANDWLPNIHGGRENLEAIEFLRELNTVTHGQHPGTVMIAEESTAWPQVSSPVSTGGLGFSMKWNMGWMHDTLEYFSKEPVHRSHHHNNLTFGMLYAYTENFLLPFSHDEVVHGKRSMLDKMPGDEWQRFANLRLLYTYMFTYPGKKLLFMGNELAQGSEWDSAGQLEWHLLQYDSHAGVKRLVGDLNNLYRHLPALHRFDFEPAGFKWLGCEDSANSVISFARSDGEHTVVIALNFTPVPRHEYRINVDAPGYYQEIFNSDSAFYGGSNLGNGAGCDAREDDSMDQACSLYLTLPPLGAIILQRQ